MVRARSLPTHGLSLIVCILIGCGGAKPKLYPVSGTVTLDGRPLAQGVIYFKTVQTGAIESFPIADGQFSGQAQPGDRRVEVTSYVKKAKPVDFNGMKGDVQENIIPARYNLESKLAANVKADGSNQYKFDLATK